MAGEDRGGEELPPGGVWLVETQAYRPLVGGLHAGDAAEARVRGRGAEVARQPRGLLIGPLRVRAREGLPVGEGDAFAQPVLDGERIESERPGLEGGQLLGEERIVIEIRPEDERGLERHAQERLRAPALWQVGVLARGRRDSRQRDLGASAPPNQAVWLLLPALDYTRRLPHRLRPAAPGEGSHQEDHEKKEEEEGG